MRRMTRETIAALAITVTFPLLFVLLVAVLPGGIRPPCVTTGGFSLLHLAAHHLPYN